MKKVILFGKGELAIKIASWFLENKNHDLILVVPEMPEPTWTPSLANWCENNKIPLIESGNYSDISEINSQDFNIDLAVSIFYGKIFKEWFINKCQQIINLHNGPLPRYRGVSPINWALKNGEKEHGVTIHQITPGIDEGPIFSQVKFSIYPHIDEVKDILQKCYDFGWLLFLNTIEKIDFIKPRSQDEKKALIHYRAQDHLLGERKGFSRKEP